MHVYVVRNSRHSGSYFRVRAHVEFIIITITLPFRNRRIQRDLTEWRTDFFRSRAPACVRMLQRDSLSLVILLRNLQRRRRRRGEHAHTGDDVSIIARNTIIYIYTYRSHVYVLYIYIYRYIYESARACSCSRFLPCFFVLYNPQLKSYKFFFVSIFFLPPNPPPPPSIHIPSPSHRKIIMRILCTRRI